MGLSVIPGAFELISNPWIHEPQLGFFPPESGKREASHCHSKGLIFYHSLCHGVLPGDEDDDDGSMECSAVWEGF